MNVHSCLICIGSNKDRETNLSFARKALKEYFPDILYGKEISTLPIHLKNSALFSNQLGKFTTSLEAYQVKDIFKMIEKTAGRLITDKQQEIVRLDIDLLKYDETILKPQDMQREYIREGIQSLLK